MFYTAYLYFRYFLNRTAFQLIDRIIKSYWTIDKYSFQQNTRYTLKQYFCIHKTTLNTFVYLKTKYSVTGDSLLGDEHFLWDEK